MGQAQTIHYHSRVGGRAGGVAIGEGEKSRLRAQLAEAINTENFSGLNDRLDGIAARATEAAKEVQRPDLKTTIQDLLYEWQQILRRLSSFTNTSPTEKAPTFKKSEAVGNAMHELILERYGQIWLTNNKILPARLQDDLPEMGPILEYKEGIPFFYRNDFRDEFKSYKEDLEKGDKADKQWEDVLDILAKVKTLDKANMVGMLALMTRMDNKAIRDAVPVNVRNVVYQAVWNNFLDPAIKEIANRAVLAGKDIQNIGSWFYTENPGLGAIARYGGDIQSNWGFGRENIRNSAYYYMAAISARLAAEVAAEAPKIEATSAAVSPPLLLTQLEAVHLVAERLVTNPPRTYFLGQITDVIRSYALLLPEAIKSTDVGVLQKSFETSKLISTLIRLYYERAYIETGEQPSLAQFAKEFQILTLLPSQGSGLKQNWNTREQALQYFSGNIGLLTLRSSYAVLKQLQTQENISIAALYDEVLTQMKQVDSVKNIPVMLKEPIWEQAQKAVRIGLNRAFEGKGSDQSFYVFSLDNLSEYGDAHKEWGVSKVISDSQLARKRVYEPPTGTTKIEPSTATSSSSSSVAPSIAATPYPGSSKTCRRHSKRQCPAKDTPADAQYQRGLRCGVYYWKQTDGTSIPKGKTNTMKFDAATGKVFVKQYCRPQSKEVLPIPDQGAVAAEAKRSLLVQRAIELGVKRADRLKVSQLRKAIKIATSQ